MKLSYTWQMYQFMIFYICFSSIANLAKKGTLIKNLTTFTANEMAYVMIIVPVYHLYVLRTKY